MFINRPISKEPVHRIWKWLKVQVLKIYIFQNDRRRVSQGNFRSDSKNLKLVKIKGQLLQLKHSFHSSVKELCITEIRKF